MNTLNLDVLRHTTHFMDLCTKRHFVFVNKTTYKLNDTNEQKYIHLINIIRRNGIRFVLDSMTTIEQAKLFVKYIPIKLYKRELNVVSWSKPLTRYFKQISVKKWMQPRPQQSNLIRRKREENEYFDNVHTNRTLRCVKRKTCMTY